MKDNRIWPKIAAGILLTLTITLFITITIIGTPIFFGTQAASLSMVRNANPPPIEPGAKDDRNLTWQMMNHNCSPQSVHTNPIDISLCRILHPNSEQSTRRQYLLLLRRGGTVNFADAQLDRLLQVLSEGSADPKIALIRGLAADSPGGIRLHIIVVDQQRLRLFLWGETIPLE